MGLSKRFSSPKDARAALAENLPLVSGDSATESGQQSKNALVALAENVPQVPADDVPGSGQQTTAFPPITFEHCTPQSSLSSLEVVREDTIMNAFCRLDSAEQVVVAAKMISHIGSSSYDLIIPDDFLSLALKAMHKVTSEGRSNIIYGLCKGLGTSRPNDPNQETYFPSSRMPMGLLEYMVNFFITVRGNMVCNNTMSKPLGYFICNDYTAKMPQ